MSASAYASITRPKYKDDKFIPRKMPRYLPGSVSRQVVVNDLKAFNDHRRRVFDAKPLVDTKPPVLVIQKFLRADKLTRDAAALNRIQMDNLKLLAKINIINRTQGHTDTWNRLANEVKSKWRNHRRNMMIISRDNRKLYRRLTDQTAFYSSKELDRAWKHNLDQIIAKAKYPVICMSQKTLDQVMAEHPDIYEDIVDPEIINARPRVYMEFGLPCGVYLGKIIIELYNDIVPETVEMFLKYCEDSEDGTYKGQEFYKVRPGQYCEIGCTPKRANLVNSIFNMQFSQENFILEHSRPGVLSLVNTDHLLNNLQFSITFDKYPPFDSKRVAFGKVIKGFKALCAVQDLGKQQGRPTEKITIINCGIVEKKQ